MKSETTTENNLEYVFYFNKEDRLIKWDDCKSIEKSYWTEVFKNIPPSHYVIITENTKYLPKYGDDVVVVLKSDEFTSDIEYIDRVRAVFRNHFDRKYFHNRNVFFLPLPYLGKIGDSSITPILEREIDVFFAGQVVYPERGDLSKVVLALKDSKKELEIVFKKTQKFFSGWDINQYLKKLGSSKISLCPRGASAETYRHFESLRYGCVVISTPLPDVWYFRDAPIQIVQQWQELPKLLNGLLGDKNLLEKISKNSIDYWNNKLSPKAVSTFIQSKL